MLGGPRARCSTPERCREGRITSLHVLVTILLMQPMILLRGMQAYSADSCWASCQQTPSNHSPQGCFWTIFLPACIFVWDFTNPHAGPRTWSCWISWVSQRPTSPACQDPSGCTHSLKHVNCTAELGVIGKLAQAALDPTVHVIDNTVKQCQSQYWPLKNPFITGLHLDNPLSVALQPISYPLSDPSIKLIPLQFTEENVNWDSVKCFADSPGRWCPSSSLHTKSVTWL